MAVKNPKNHVFAVFSTCSRYFCFALPLVLHVLCPSLPRLKIMFLFLWVPPNLARTVPKPSMLCVPSSLARTVPKFQPQRHGVLGAPQLKPKACIKVMSTC